MLKGHDMRKVLFLGVVAGLFLSGAASSALAQTDEEVVKAIDKGRAFILSQQGGDGKWPEKSYWHSPTPCGHTEISTMTMIYTGSHPLNSDEMSKALDSMMGTQITYTYAVCCRTMAYAYALKKIKSPGPRRDAIRLALIADAQWLVNNQKPEGNWGYSVKNPRPDFSNTQFAILALWEASKVGVEVPASVWQKALTLYLKEQQSDGSWNYGPNTEHTGAGYGSMTAAGLATIYICSDMLNMAGGCPCIGGKSGGASRADLDKKIDLALDWLDKNFTVEKNPGGAMNDWRMYWLYAVERVGMAAGYKYFGSHNWYKEGVVECLSKQNGDGSWPNEAEGSTLATTCFATLFLYKGRAPLLFNKLQATPGGEKWRWDAHRRDIPNLTAYFEKDKEEAFQWQVVSLRGTLEELHEAPILYISAETAPNFTDDEKKKLREFTDTGGTIVFEASCGAPAVRKWFADFAKEVWPEWAVKPLGPDHGSFTDPKPLKKRPEILGIDDGIRTCVFYSMDDVSCAWQTKAYTARDYIFQWGINLFTYATDHSPLRGRLASAKDLAKSDRYTSAVKPGAKPTLTIARLKSDGDWITDRNYKGTTKIAEEVQKRATVTVKFEDEGVDATALSGKDAAFLTGSKEVTLPAPQQQALKDYLSKDGFLWAEAAAGSTVFDASFRKLVAGMGLELKYIEKTEPMMTGNFPKALGYNLTTGVQFRHAMKIPRLGRPFAELVGIYQGTKLVGVYSPIDVVFSVNSYDAYNDRGYQAEDAMAVATNILLGLSDR
jgi:hypothetical protein